MAPSPTVRILPAVLVAFVVLAAFVTGKAARDTLVLAHFDVSRLPMFSSIAAALSLPFVIVVGRLMARYGPRRLVGLANVVGAALLVAEWLVFATAPRFAAVLAFVHLSILGGVLVSGFWSVINERFDVRTGKRAVARIGLGATLGGVAGGLIAERASVYLQIETLLLVVAALQVIAGLAIWRIGAPAGVHATVETVDVDQTRTAFGLVRRNALLRNLAALLILGAVAAAVLDYAFKAELARTLAPDGVLRTLAVYHTVVNVVTALVQLLLSRQIVVRLGVARALGTLPVVATVGSLVAWLAPSAWSIVAARGGEMVVRSSVFRAAYELIYAPLSRRDKRAAKVLLDVGSERVGDLLGAQLVAILVWSLDASNAALVACAALVGAIAVAIASRVPRNYTAALEHTLLDRSEARPVATVADAGDLTTLSLLDLGALDRAIQPPPAPVHEVATPPADAIAVAVDKLRSRDAATVRAMLRTTPRAELAPFVVPLLAWDAVWEDAAKSLRATAPACTGVLADALRDESVEFAIRRRIPPILAEGERELAAWALARMLGDSRFEVRYACARALAHLQGRGVPALELATVAALVQTELAVSSEKWRSYRLLDLASHASDERDPDAALRQILHRRSEIVLDHVFNLLGLALPARPLRVAFQSLYADDRAMRAIALEYLENAIPTELRGQLWRHLEAHERPAPSRRPVEDVANELLLSQPDVALRLSEVAARARDMRS